MLLNCTLRVCSENDCLSHVSLSEADGGLICVLDPRGNAAPSAVNLKSTPTLIRASLRRHNQKSGRTIALVGRRRTWPPPLSLPLLPDRRHSSPLHHGHSAFFGVPAGRGYQFPLPQLPPQSRIYPSLANGCSSSSCCSIRCRRVILTATTTSPPHPFTRNCL